MDYPRYMPIMLKCEERLALNAYSREDYRIEYHIDDENLIPNSTESIEDTLGLNDPDISEKEIKHMAYIAAREKMTDKQRAALDLYYGRSMTDKEVGHALGCNQQMANRHRHAAEDRIKKSTRELKTQLLNRIHNKNQTPAKRPTISHRGVIIF